MISTTKLYQELIEMLETGEHTDCVFQLKSTTTSNEKKHELVRAHKVVLCAASPVLNVMLSKEWNSENKAIELKDDDADLFKIFINTIYTNILSLDNLETVIALHKMAHKYQTEDVLELTTNFIIEKCDVKNVLSIADMAWPYGNKKLRKYCKKILSKHLKDLVKLPEFLEVKSMTVNKIYSLNQSKVVSDNLLVTKLDQYVVKNKINDSEIMLKLKSAVESISILLVKDVVINQTMDEDLKKLILKQKRKFMHSSNVHQELDQLRVKQPLLYRLPPKVVGELYFWFNNDRYCQACRNNHSKVKCRYDLPTPYSNNISTTYNKYGHSRLDEYSDSDLKAILEVFKQAGICGGLFNNYESYLEP